LDALQVDMEYEQQLKALYSTSASAEQMNDVVDYFRDETLLFPAASWNALAYVSSHTSSINRTVGRSNGMASILGQRLVAVST
jgi:hypothetical protein